MSPRIFIIGGGYLGQLLKVYLPYARVFDWRSAPDRVPTRSLGPQYLWEPLPGLEHTTFNVYTHVDGRVATPEAVARYKAKVGKQHDGADWLAQFEPCMPGYEAVLPDVAVEYGKVVDMIDLNTKQLFMQDGRIHAFDFVLSTIPLFALLKMLPDMKPLSLSYAPIYVRSEVATVEPSIGGWMSPDMYVNYLSNEDSSYRETYRGGTRYLESLKPNGGRKLVPGKIYPDFRVPHLHMNLNSAGLFNFGRFATWNSEELAHDTIHALAAFIIATGIPARYLGGPGRVQPAVPEATGL